VTAASTHASPYGSAAARHAASVIRSRVPGSTPEIAVILGSGLGGLADQIERPTTIAFGDIPGFPATTVAGHAGKLVLGRIEGREIVAVSGRFHMYEGHDAALAGYPTRVVHAIGARTLIVTNAAGGIRRTFAPGDLMLIRDHVNLTFMNPLLGPLETGDPRFPDMSAPYDERLLDEARAVGRAKGIALHEGVYCSLIGPAYETPAEVRMLAHFGVDAVGMSTVPEVIVAAALGMRVLGISCIANLACGLTLHPVTHAEVLANSAKAAGRLIEVVRGVIEGRGKMEEGREQ
jgi:purine-nucleoside phosphorylase